MVGFIRWMNVTDHLRREAEKKKHIDHIVFDGEPFTALSLIEIRNQLFSNA